jgi:hypothetical protein
MPVTENRPEAEPGLDHEFEAQSHVEVKAPTIGRPARAHICIEKKPADSPDPWFETEAGTDRVQLTIASGPRIEPARKRSLNRKRIDNRESDTTAPL